MPEPITGNESTIDPTTPQGALAEFYRAFNSRDLVLMERNWLNLPEASMDNPVGEIRRGWEEIRRIYQGIFAGAGIVRVEFYDYSLHVFQDAFLAVGRERGNYKSPDRQIALQFRTSRWFKRVDERWRQLHHHGSVDDPALLAAYQTAVRAGSDAQGTTGHR